MNDGILSRKIKKKSLLNFLLSLLFLITGILLVLTLSGSGLISMDGYLQPYDVQNSMQKIDKIVNSPLGFDTYTITLKSSAHDIVDACIELTSHGIASANYVAARVGDKYILCLISKGTYDTWPVGEGLTFTGVLDQTDPEVVSMVITDMAKDNIGEAEARELLYGYMIDTRKTGFVSRSVQYLLFLAIWFFGIFFFIRGIRPIINIYNHPAVRKLSQYGTVEYILAQIEEQLAGAGDANAYRVGKKSNVVHLLSGWVVIESLFNIKISKSSDLLWAYKMKQTIKHYGIITAGVSYCAKLNCKGNVMSVPGDEFSVDRLLGAVSGKYPWVVVGFNDELETMWNSDMEQFLANASATGKTGSVDPTSADNGIPTQDRKGCNDFTIPC